MPYRDPDIARQKSAERMRKMRAQRKPPPSKSAAAASGQADFSGMAAADIGRLIWEQCGRKVALGVRAKITKKLAEAETEGSA